MCLQLLEYFGWTVYSMRLQSMFSNNIPFHNDVWFDQSLDMAWWFIQNSQKKYGNMCHDNDTLRYITVVVTLFALQTPISSWERVVRTLLISDIDIYLSSWSSQAMLSFHVNLIMEDKDRVNLHSPPSTRALSKWLDGGGAKSLQSFN